MTYKTERVVVKPNFAHVRRAKTQYCFVRRFYDQWKPINKMKKHPTTPERLPEIISTWLWRMPKVRTPHNNRGRPISEFICCGDRTWANLTSQVRVSPKEQLSTDSHLTKDLDRVINNVSELLTVIRRTGRTKGLNSPEPGHIRTFRPC